MKNKILKMFFENVGDKGLPLWCDLKKSIEDLPKVQNEDEQKFIDVAYEIAQSMCEPEKFIRLDKRPANTKENKLR